MSFYKGKKECSKESTVLTAVALQDHLVKSLSLKDPFKKDTPCYRKQNHTKQNKVSLQPENHARKNNMKMKLKEKPRQGSKDPDKFGVERVLDPEPKPLSLAQKLGVVAAPEPLLTEKQWEKVKCSSNSRNDSLQPCAICQDNFACKEQVLLSCSHVFHRVCLQSFEKYSRKKSCPMCRKEQYQTRLIYEGARFHITESAIKIQAHWRGYLARRWYKKFREIVPPNDPRLRRKFFENKLSNLTEKVVSSLERCGNEVDSLINASNDNISYSRIILSQVTGSQANSLVNWFEIQKRAQSLNICECPICMTPFKDEDPSKETRAIALLSCSHVFHDCCLQMYEDCYPTAHPHCPVCRTVYLKKKLSSVFEDVFSS